MTLEEVYHHNNYHLGSIYCLAWNKESDLLASGSNDRNINLLYKRVDSCRYEPCGSIRNPGGVVREVEFVDDGLVGVGGGGLRIMSPERLTITYQSTTEKHTFCVCSIEDRILATGDEAGCVNIWDIRQRSPVYTYNAPLDRSTATAEYSAVTSIDFNNDNLSFATNSGWCYTLIYSCMGKEPVNRWSPHGNAECRSLRYSSNGDWIVTGSYSGSVGVTNTDTLEHTNICEHSDKVIQARVYQSMEQLIMATASADKTACLWKLIAL